MSAEYRPAPRSMLRVALAGLVMAAMLLAIGSSSLATPQSAEPASPKFAVHCTQATCTLVVTGLPEPLGGDFAMTLVSGDEAGSASPGSAPAATVLTAEVPAFTAGLPALVSRYVPESAPSPPSVSPQVPQEPPKLV